MSGILLISKSSLFLDCVGSQIGEKLPNEKPIIVDHLSDIPIKLSNQIFQYVFSDYLTLPFKGQAFHILGEAKKTKTFLFCEHFGDILPKYRDEKNIHIISCPYYQESLNFNFGQILEGEPTEKYLWGKGIKEFTLRGDEVLFNPGVEESAVYLVKSGCLVRKSPDGKIIDDNITEGHVIGELTYFENRPKPWGVIAKEDSQLVRIPYSFIDKEIEALPVWVKAMFGSLALRALKYSKAS